MKSEPEEDVVIVKDDEEEVEKREVFIYTRKVYLLFLLAINLYHSLFF
jgi:hypothetical protein